MFFAERGHLSAVFSMRSSCNDDSSENTSGKRKQREK